MQTFLPPGFLPAVSTQCPRGTRLCGRGSPQGQALLSGARGRCSNEHPRLQQAARGGQARRGQTQDELRIVSRFGVLTPGQSRRASQGNSENPVSYCCIPGLASRETDFVYKVPSPSYCVNAGDGEAGGGRDAAFALPLAEPRPVTDPVSTYPRPRPLHQSGEEVSPPH